MAGPSNCFVRVNRRFVDPSGSSFGGGGRDAEVARMMDASPTLRSFWNRCLKSVRYVGRHERPVLLLILFVSFASWGFAEIADEVMEGETMGVDERILLALRNPENRADPWGPPMVEEIARDITGLGGVAILSGLTLAAAGYLALRGKRRAMIFLLAAIGGGIVASSLLKMGFDRPRPALVPHGSHVYTASFPSGHSMMSAVTYLTLGALLAKVESRRAIRAYLLALAALITFLVGVSRIYLGVHWPTDVLAGWTVGAAWAAGCWTVANLLQRRGTMEGHAET